MCARLCRAGSRSPAFWSPWSLGVGCSGFEGQQHVVGAGMELGEHLLCARPEAYAMSQRRDPPRCPEGRPALDGFQSHSLCPRRLAFIPWRLLDSASLVLWL